ncbi:MAG TPA: hypothetical protein PLY40_04720 [Bacillota bacterium]|nr:hypothetical protein [Bacillota bacterium]
MDKAGLLDLIQTKREAERKREAVRSSFIAASPRVNGGAITGMAVSDLQLLFSLYDAIFFNSYFTGSFAGSITFSLSTRMSRSAGKIIYPRNLKGLPPDQEKYELRLGLTLFFDYYRLSREKKVNGIYTRDALEAFLLVFEHELCHLIELHLFRQSNCQKQRFKSLAYNLFGHTESYHQLPTSREIAAEQFNLNIGDRVAFTVENHNLEGIINNINKRATVMVPDHNGDYRDARGRRYTKWYVPLPSLKKK